MGDTQSILNTFIYDGKMGLTIVTAKAGTGPCKQNVTHEPIHSSNTNNWC